MKRFPVRQTLVTLVPALLVLAVVLVVRLRFGVTVSFMTGDLASTVQVSPLLGFVSNLGVLLWSAAASTCAFAAVLLRRVAPRGVYRFLLSSALLSAYLLVDDLFMIHDNLAGRYLGLSEPLVFAALGIGVAAYFITNRRAIAATDFPMLLTALAFFAASILLDQFIVDAFPPGHGLYFLEDGTKWLGIACWCSYYVRTSYQFAVRAQESTAPEEVPAHDPLADPGAGDVGLGVDTVSTVGPDQSWTLAQG